MAKEYDEENPVTMANEPSVAYVSCSSAPKTMPITDSMTVDEYFEKVRKALDKRYIDRDTVFVDRILPSKSISN